MISAKGQPTSRLGAAVGSCYTADSVSRVLGNAVDEVGILVEAGQLLALTTADGYVVFPVFQLHNGRVVEGLPPVLSALREGVDDPWTWALWLNSTPPRAEEVEAQASRIQQLIYGEFDRVLRAAERTAASWRS